MAASESASPSISPSRSPSVSASASVSQSASPSASPSVSPSKSPSVSPSTSTSSSVSSSPSASPSAPPITAKKIYDLDHMNEASRRAGGVGTLLMGGAIVPDVGSIHVVRKLKYETTPAVKSATATKTALALTASAQVGVTAGIVQPDVPRTMTIKGNASGMSGNVTIHGTNMAGTVVSDTIALNGAVEVLGVVGFASVTSIDYPAETHSSTDTISIGRGAGIAFPSPINNTSAVLTHDLDNANDVGTVVADKTLGKSVYIVSGALNGAKVLSLTYVV